MDIAERARRYAALGDPIRLAMVDALAVSDLTPSELATRRGLPSNLLAHHLGVLEHAGIIERAPSSGDGRRRYVRLRSGALPGRAAGARPPAGPVLFVCTHNSARSQLAAALWEQDGAVALSAGTHPASQVHPGAVAAAAGAGLDLSGNRPRHLDEVTIEPALIVTVCDRAHEELEAGEGWWHWSIPDPVEDRSPKAFSTALTRIRARIETIKGRTPS
jgi:protein-tyrosine-phosphatase/DNA-binding transcriptional ArsR family regulator